jgi:hypothetical protein
LTARRTESRFSSRALSLALCGLTFASAAPNALAQAVPPPPAAPTAPPVAAPATPATNAATAKTALAAGDKAAKVKDWATALTQYQAAMNAQSGPAAQAGIANAQYQAKNTGDAYEAYDRLLKDYNGGANKAQATARLKELAPLTGYVSIRVNESGAAVSIDGKAIGMSPVAALIRVSMGTHKIDIVKDGFAPLSKSPNVSANGKEIVDVQMVRESTTGHLTISEKTGAAVRVLVDGADMGAAPLDLDVTPGSHQIVVRSSSMASPAQTVQIGRGETQKLELTAVAASAHLEVTTSDRKGVIFLDGKPVAEGAYAADVAIGPHTIAVTLEGYERYEKKITLADKETFTETVTMKRPEAQAAGPAREERTFDGLYGGLGLFGMMEPGGNHNEVQEHCSQLDATSCTSPSPIGGGLMGWVGYAWHPVGIELFLAGEYDQNTPSATFLGPTSPLENPLAVGVQRVEQFAFLRVGGMGAVRARLSFQTERIRGSFAAGFGLSVKDMLFERDTKSNNGGENVYTDKSGHTYVSPALSLDASIALRVSPSVAVALGLMGWFEAAGQSVQSKASPDAYIGSGSVTPVPISTPSYHLATSTQIFVGPYLGLQFGP